MAAINNMIRKYGALDPVFGQEQYAQIPMAVVGIVMKFFQIVISIVVGCAAGCIPIVGYCMGAGLRKRVSSLFTRLLITEAAVGAISLVIVEFFPGQLIALFGAANESTYYTQFALKAFRIYLCMIVFACVNKACFIFLQAMGKAVQSTVLSMIREIGFGVGFALLLPLSFGLDGVLYSMPLSDILTFIISLVLIIQTYHELGSKFLPSKAKTPSGQGNRKTARRISSSQRISRERFHYAMTYCDDLWITAHCRLQRSLFMSFISGLVLRITALRRTEQQLPDRCR